MKITVPRAAIPFVIDPVVAVFRKRHPRIEVEVAIEDRLVDIVAEGYDAGVRLTESMERDMVQVRAELGAASIVRRSREGARDPPPARRLSCRVARCDRS